eukprot:7299410-Pyramimonas_sp.AAC.1
MMRGLGFASPAPASGTPPTNGSHDMAAQQESVCKPVQKSFKGIQNDRKRMVELFIRITLDGCKMGIQV